MSSDGKDTDRIFAYLAKQSSGKASARLVMDALGMTAQDIGEAYAVEAHGARRWYLQLRMEPGKFLPRIAHSELRIWPGARSRTS